MQQCFYTTQSHVSYIYISTYVLSMFALVHFGKTHIYFIEPQAGTQYARDSHKGAPAMCGVLHSEWPAIYSVM